MARVLPSWNDLLRLGARAEFGSVGKWIGISSVIGVLGGLAAVLFEATVHGLRAYVIAPFAGAHGEGLGEGGPREWATVLVLVLGGLLVGWLTKRFSPESRGGGTEHVIDTFHRRGGTTKLTEPLFKGVTASLTIASGGSVGQEGPIAQVGAGIGSRVATALRLTKRDRRVFLLAGASAGIGALFTAPLGAALFAPEVLYRKPEFEGEAIIPCIIASILSYTTFTTITGHGRVLELDPELVANLSLGNPAELALYFALAILCTLVGWLYVRTGHGVERLFGRATFVPEVVRPAVGGLALGLLAVAIVPWCGEHGILQGGYDLMRSAIAGRLEVGVMAVLIGAKILGTALTVYSGGSGGKFAPSLAIGALLGACVGQVSATAFPTLGVQTEAFALVGMGGFFAGVAKTPIASILIVCEMTGGYGLLAPLMLVSVLHLLFARGWGVFGTQVEGLVDSPAHTGDFVVDVLERVRVRELLDGARRPTLVREDTTLRRALEIVSTAPGYYFPVVDEDDLLVGIFSLTDVRRIFHETEVADLVIVSDFMVDSVVTTRPDATLSEALAALNEHGLHEVPVVATDDPRRVLAMLTRNNMGAAYHRRLHALRRAEEAPGA